MTESKICTCPSGDGSLRWPCPKHPAVEQAEAEGPEMSPERAAYFMRRFKSEEKLLGPNEQAAVDYVLSLLAQHDRIVGELRAKAVQLREALEWRAENQAGQRELLRSVKAERDAALARVAELEKQEPVALANRGNQAFWVKWTEAAAGLYGPGIKLYAAPVAQAQHSVPGDIMRDAQRYRWLRDQQFYFSFSTENSDAGISSCTAGMSSRFKNLSWVDAAIDSAIAAAPGKVVGHE
ncbi:hypothetical protein QJ517_06030 [Pseudomonas aeruginosa]|uniref:hypothetical protein n=1 Tax=Pseudomonas aeruginosa TaxID=287 RepID=UPI00249C8391|nr:hypothetical protein [Pseudomonas aeruginosa]MDI2703204.1 hypothetical protein [Pseudomonas aeruginosa]